MLGDGRLPRAPKNAVGFVNLQSLRRLVGRSFSGRCNFTPETIEIAAESGHNGILIMGAAFDLRVNPPINLHSHGNVISPAKPLSAAA